MGLNLCVQVFNCFCLSSSGQLVCNLETGCISQLLPQPCCVTTTIKSWQSTGRISFRVGICRSFCFMYLSSASQVQAFGLGTSMAHDWRTSPVTMVPVLFVVVTHLLTLHCWSKFCSPTQNAEGVACAPPYDCRELWNTGATGGAPPSPMPGADME